MDKNLNMIEDNKMTLGMVIKNLKELDHSDDNHLFTDADFELLKDITNIRNHLTHKVYCEFVYSSDSKDFIEQARQLEKDHDHLEKLSKAIESVRIKALRQYGRIK